MALENIEILKNKSWQKTGTNNNTPVEINTLVIKARQGDLEAFEKIYGQFAQRIFKYIRLKIQNRQEAEDILQDTFIKAFKGLGSLRAENLNFSAWLYRVAGNTINDYFRKRYRLPETVNLDNFFDLADNTSLQKDVAHKSDMELAKAAFRQLPPIYKMVLELRFLQDLSIAETAKAVNKSSLSVRLIQHRALKKVKLILNKSSEPTFKKI